MNRITQTFATASAALLAVILASPSAHAQWNVTVQNLYDNAQTATLTSLIGGTIDTIVEAETVLANGGAPEATQSIATIHYLGTGGGSNLFPAGNIGTNPFPTGSGTGSGANKDHFALQATSLVSVVGGSTASLFFYTTTDDGFKVELNGNTVFQNNDNAYDTNRVSQEVTVRTGDLIRFVYFEREGGEFAYLYSDTDGDLSTQNDRGLLTSGANGVVVQAKPTNAVPEAGSLVLLAPVLGLIGLVARRRR